MDFILYIAVLCRYFLIKIRVQKLFYYGKRGLKIWELSSDFHEPNCGLKQYIQVPKSKTFYDSHEEMILNPCFL